MTIDSDWLLNRLFCGVVSLSVLIGLAAVMSRSRCMKNSDMPMRWIEYVAPNHFPQALVVGYMGLRGFIMTFVEAPSSA